MISLAVITILSYLVGSIPFALIAGRLSGVNLRDHGSGNAGATNALRVLGPRVGALVFLGDFSKGLMATILVATIRIDGLPVSPAVAMVIAGSAAMLGHIFTVFASFRGGKGVATGAGMLAGLVPGAVAIAIAIFAVVVWVTRYVSLGSILATMSLPATLLIGDAVGAGVAPIKVWFCVAVPLLIIYTHRANVQRLLSGTESRIKVKDREA